MLQSRTFVRTHEESDKAVDDYELSPEKTSQPLIPIKRDKAKERLMALGEIRP
jgi:hypothetical protein